MPRNDMKAYTTVLARIPQDLADEVKRYAGIHRCSVSELIRDGLEMRLEAGDVPGRTTGHHGDDEDEVLHEVLQAIKALAPMGQAAIRQIISEVLHEVLPKYVSREQGQQEGHTEVLQGITGVLPHESEEVPHDSKGMTSVLPQHPQEHAHEHEGMTEVLHTPGAVDHVGYDPGKFSLGKLCPQSHAHQDTGKSLLRRSNQRCWECDKAMKRAIKARQRAARQEEPR